MSEFFEIAYAAVSKRLCLFTGTGFSKAISENSAPSWQGLLEAICDKCSNPVSIRESLFPHGSSNPLSLEEAAQVIAIELNKNDLSIHTEAASLIRELKISGDNGAIADFFAKQSFQVVTTNYDKLVEELCGEADCHSLTPGLPIPRSAARVEVYHVHGSVDSPANMIVTSDDYFRFVNSESYFSRKLSTVLHENTVVIIGYSLGDANLKAIVSDYKGFSKNHVIGSNLFLVSRSSVPSYIKDYYAHCYGIRVIDNMEAKDFFENVNYSIPSAEKCVDSSVGNIKDVVFNGKVFTKDFLKLENSFWEIVSSIGAVGLSIDDPRVVAALGAVIETKRQLAGEPNAWSQYEHLARWLIYLASILELKGTSIEETFLTAVLMSMTTMSNRLLLGYSWHAYRAWDDKWAAIIASNRALIGKHVGSKTMWPDAIAIVNRN